MVVAIQIVKIKLLEEENLETLDENKRIKMVNAYYRTNWKINQQDAAETEVLEADQTAQQALETEDLPSLGKYVAEIEKLAMEL